MYTYVIYDSETLAALYKIDAYDFSLNDGRVRFYHKNDELVADVPLEGRILAREGAIRLAGDSD